MQAASFSSVNEIGISLFQAIHAAQDAIIRSSEEMLAIGTTTLVGGAIIKLDILNDSTIPQDYEWAFIGINVGDCKIYHWSVANKELIDITNGNRTNLTNASDPGGRLGPRSEDGKPDLRNLNVYFQLCKKGDLLLLVSDGVHDNFDPQQLGVQPHQLQINASTWIEAEEKFQRETGIAKNAFSTQLMTRKIFNDDKMEPHNVTTDHRVCCDSNERRKGVYAEQP